MSQLPPHFSCGLGWKDVSSLWRKVTTCRPRAAWVHACTRAHACQGPGRGPLLRRNAGPRALAWQLHYTAASNHHRRTAIDSPRPIVHVHVCGMFNSMHRARAAKGQRAAYVEMPVVGSVGQGRPFFCSRRSARAAGRRQGRAGQQSALWWWWGHQCLSMAGAHVAALARGVSTGAQHTLLACAHTSSVEVLVLPVRVGAGVLDEVLASQTTQACPCTNIQA